MNIEDVAKICHAAHRAYCQAQGDFSVKEWDEAEEYQRLASISGVVFHMQSRSAWPSATHDDWVACMTGDGWEFGQEKDVAKKTHPGLVPYRELPKESRAKDWIFAAIVKALHPFFPCNPTAT